MGTAKTSVAIALVVLLWAPTWVVAEPSCTARTETGRAFPICFDPGNRLFLGSGSGGLGIGIRLRHAIEFDDEPDLSWKLEHRILEGSITNKLLAGDYNDHYQGVVYSGRYVRHARDGHIVIPLGVPRKVFVPFDIGGEAEVGRFRQRHGQSPLQVGVIRVAGLVDLSRTPSFHRYLTIGVVAKWDVKLADGNVRELEVLENRVAPLSILNLSGGLESQDGLSLAQFTISGGRQWSSLRGWQWKASASVAAERILIAINDRPLSVIIKAGAASNGSAPASGDSEIMSLTATMGVRLSLFSSQLSLTGVL